MLTCVTFIGGAGRTAHVLRREPTRVPPAMHGDPQRTRIYAYGKVSVTLANFLHCLWQFYENHLTFNFLCFQERGSGEPSQDGVRT